MNRHDSRTKQTQSGFTIVEIMVALVIGLVVIAGVIQIFLATKKTSKLQNAVSQVQENGRFAIDFLTHDIRGAGFWGCGGGSKFTITNNLNDTGGASSIYQEFGNAVKGGLDTNTSSTVSPANAPASSDTITLSGATGASWNVNDITNTTSAAIHITSTSTLQVGDIALICDPNQAYIIQLSSNPSNDPNGTGQTITHNTGTINAPSGGGTLGPGNQTQSLSGLDKTNALIYQANTVTYSIVVPTDSNGVALKDNGGNDIYALARKVNGGTTQVLVNGVEDMQFEYGVDTDGDGSANYYANATQVSNNNNWPNVVSVRVALLVQSSDNIARQDPYSNKYFTLLDTKVGPYNDRYVREVFTTTVMLRNHIN